MPICKEQEGVFKIGQCTKWLKEKMLTFFQDNNNLIITWLVGCALNPFLGV